MSREKHHGVDTLEIERGPRPVKTEKSSVIGLVGTAPKGPVNTLTGCLSEKTRLSLAMRQVDLPCHRPCALSMTTVSVPFWWSMCLTPENIRKR
nr:major tail sheath protein [Candidatus Pantoea persica]